MDSDERERRDWPDEDGGDRPTEPDPTASHEEPSAPLTEETGPPEADRADAWGGPTSPGDRASDAAATGDEGETGAPAEIESWPSQEQAPTGRADEADAWPTQPPAAESAPDDAWPTAAPERRADESAPEPDWTAAAAPAGGTEPAAGDRDERAPEEVEAYPAPGPGPEEVAAAAAVTPAHTVPDAEASTGESTQCPRCGTENRPGLSFCRNCGQRLVAAGVASTVERPGAPEGTMACPRCGTHNRAGVAFCQNCGANLRGTAEGYVPPAAAPAEPAAVAEPARRGAVLGPVVLLIGLAGLVTGYLLPFLYGAADSLLDRAWGADGYGVAFWSGYPEVSASLADQVYFGLAGPLPILGLLLVALAVAGFVRAAPGPLQSIGLLVALLWSVGLIVLFVVVELLANWGGDMVAVLRALSPAGIIFFLSGLIVLIGILTRFSRG